MTYLDNTNEEVRTMVTMTKTRDKYRVVKNDVNLFAELSTELWTTLVHPNMRRFIERGIAQKWFDVISHENFKKALAEYKAYLKA